MESTIEITQIAISLVTAGVLYGALRAEINALREQSRRYDEDITVVHKRIDDHIQHCHVACQRAHNQGMEDFQ